MPGWLPTAIVVNIFDPEFPDKRRGQAVAEGDHIRVEDGTGAFDALRLPDGFQLPGWSPKELPPVEVIDGQHRLWAVVVGEIASTSQMRMKTSNCRW